MQVTIKPIRTWLIGADFLLSIITTIKICQHKFNYNIAVGVVLGAFLGIVLTMLMKVKFIGKVLQVGVSYYWTSILTKFFGVTKKLMGTNEYYLIFAVIFIIFIMIHIAQVDDLKS